MASEKPPWLKKKIEFSSLRAMKELTLRLGLHTICESARCPNQSECFGRGTATFLIMGTRCTRQCTFCNVTHGQPESLDAEEPIRIAKAVKRLGLRYAVITSVTRDDLEDGGASILIWCRCLCPFASPFQEDLKIYDSQHLISPVCTDGEQSPGCG